MDSQVGKHPAAKSRLNAAEGNWGWLKTRNQIDHSEGPPRQDDAKDEGELSRRFGKDSRETRPRAGEESMARFTRALTEFLN